MLFKNIFSGLNEKKVRYLVAGGVAVVLHGHTRFTFDLDLIVDLEEKNTRKFLEGMEGLGFKPRLPVRAQDFAVKSIRESWIREKNMQVFSFYNSASPWTGPVDVFVKEPMPFSVMDRLKEVMIVEGLKIPVVSLDHLLKLKEKAGRDKDKEDIMLIKEIKKRRKKQ